MAQGQQVLELNKADFKLNDYDNLAIEMPLKPVMSDKDIDSQLLEYAISCGKNIQTVEELDAAWVQANFEGLETIDDLRQAIKDDFDRETDFEYSEIKFHACSDALVARLEGEIPEDVLQSNVEAMRQANDARFAAMNTSLDQYLREESMTPDQYDKKLREETKHQLSLNMALDLLADVLGMQVGNHELTEYLSSPNPEAFLEEIREKGMVEQARRAAVRVKAMRRAVDTAIVNGAVEIPDHGEKQDEFSAHELDARAAGAAGAAGAAVGLAAEEAEEDIEIPDFENLPEAEIRDDNPFRMSIIDVDA